MYTEIMNTFGFSQSTLEMMVLVSVIVFVLGVILVLYWKFIVMGVIATTCVVVMANHKTPEPKQPKEEIISVVKVEPTQPIVTEKPKQDLMTDPKDDKYYFMQDCDALTTYTKEHCENIWYNREDESFKVDNAEDAKLLDVSNKEYVKRRAEALKKRGAIVAHVTYH